MVERAESSWSDSLMVKEVQVAEACRRGQTVVSLCLPPPTAAIPPSSITSLPCMCVWPEGERLEVMFPWSVAVAVVWSKAVVQESLAGSWKRLRPASRPKAAHWSLLWLLCSNGVGSEGFEQQAR